MCLYCYFDELVARAAAAAKTWIYLRLVQDFACIPNDLFPYVLICFLPLPIVLETQSDSTTGEFDRS